MQLLQGAPRLDNHCTRRCARAKSSVPCVYVLCAGYNAKPANVELVLAAFRDGLEQQGFLKK